MIGGQKVINQQETLCIGDSNTLATNHINIGFLLRFLARALDRSPAYFFSELEVLQAFEYKKKNKEATLYQILTILR
jgi:hypothetical protein